MFDLLSSAVKLADKILDVHTLHQKNKYKRKLHKLNYRNFRGTPVQSACKEDALLQEDLTLYIENLF